MKDWTMLKNNTRDIASKYFYNKTKRNPVILPIINWKFNFRKDLVEIKREKGEKICH